MVKYTFVFLWNLKKETKVHKILKKCICKMLNMYLRICVMKEFVIKKVHKKINKMTKLLTDIFKTVNINI